MGDIEGERLCLRGGGCGATVRWVLTVHHRRLDLDVDPSPHGNVIIHTFDDGRVRAEVLGGDRMPVEPPQQAFRMHRCAKPKPPGIPCAGCHLPMPRDIALQEQWTHHPGCEPGFQLRLAQDRLRERKQR